MSKILVIAGKIAVRLGKIVTTACGLCCGCGWWPANPCNIPGGACGGSGGPVVLYIDGCETLAVNDVVQIGERCYKIAPKIGTLPPNGIIVTDYTVVDDCFSPPCPSLTGTHLKAKVCVAPGSEEAPDIYICPQCITTCGGFRRGDFCYYFEPGPLVSKPPGALEAFCGPGTPPGHVQIGGLFFELSPNFKCCQCVLGCDDVIVNYPHPVTGVPLDLRCCCSPTSDYVTTWNYSQRVNYWAEDPTGGSYDIIAGAGTRRVAANGQVIGPCFVSTTITAVRPIGTTVTTNYWTLPTYGCGGTNSGVGTGCPPTAPDGGPAPIPFLEYGFFPNPGTFPVQLNPPLVTGTVTLGIECHRITGFFNTITFEPTLQTQPRVLTTISVSYTEVPVGACTGGCGQGSNESKILATAEGPFDQPLAFGFL